MSYKILFLLTLTGLLAIKETTAQGLLGSILGLVPNLLGSIADGLAPRPIVVKTCGVLKNGKQYHIKSADGRFAVVDANKKLAFVKQVPLTGATKFTAFEKGCNLYGFCVDNFCMSRCQQCPSDTGDFQTVKFHVSNTNSAISQWTVTSKGGVSGGPYYLKAGGSYGYLIYKRASNGNDQLTLDTVVGSQSGYQFIEVTQDCNILQDRKQYYLKSADGRLAVLDKNKNLAFQKQVPSTAASRFTAVKKSCNVYGLCVGSFCMSRCQQCTSDTGDFQTVRFHVSNSDGAYSKWNLTSSVVGGPYNLQVDDQSYLKYKRTTKGDDQLTLSPISTGLPVEPQFKFVEVEPDCGILQNGKQYYIKSADGRFAVLDKNKNLAFQKQVPLTGASRFTAVKKSCNVYGLCVGGFCMSRCQQCTSDTGDFQTVRFHVNNSNGAYSQWTLSSSVAGGPYNLRADDQSTLVYKRVPNGNDQLTLSSLLYDEPQFQFIEVQDCQTLQDGKEYNLKTADGRFAVLDEKKQLGFVRNIPSFRASKFTAVKKGCNVYGLCIAGHCMSRCEGCLSDTSDYETVKFHISNSDSPYSQWTITSSVPGGPYNLKVDDPHGYLIYKQTPQGDDQLTLSTDIILSRRRKRAAVPAETSSFEIVEAEQGCGILQDGKEYNLQSSDGRFAVLDENKQLGFVRDVPSFKASKFTAIQKGCNVYGLCVDGNCMSRCEACVSDTGDYQTVRFHARNSDGAYSQWTLSSSAGGLYNLKIDNNEYLTQKVTPNSENQLTLSDDVTGDIGFALVEAEQGCGILQDGKEYNLQSSDGRFAVLDENKQLGFVRDVPSFKASKFTAIQKGCNVYGLCVDGNCMSRCEACVSDTGDYQTVRFHARNSDGAYSQWTLSSSAGGLYNLKIDNNEYLTQKVTPNSENQLTLSDDVTGDIGFALVEAEQGCGILQDGKEYNLQSSDGRFAVLDENKQLGFVRDVPSFKASKFTAIQKGCNVYGLCVDGNCMSRCEACVSDTGDYQTVRFHARNSDGAYSQWTLSSSAGGLYNLKIDNNEYLTQKVTPNSENQLTLSDDVTGDIGFALVEAEQGCGILQDGKEYNLQSSDGRFAVLDENKQLGFVRDVPSFKASKFTAIQKGCNVYGLCVDGNCMSRCEACVSDTGDYQTVRFHARNSDGAYSQWTLSSSAGGLYSLKIDNNEYLTQKVTPNSENQLTLSDDVTGDIGFALVEAEQGCGILQDGKEYNLQSSDGRFAVLDENKQLGFVRDVPSFKASKFTAIQKGCNVYGLCVDGNCMSRCEACVSDTGDYQTVRFHARNSDGAYSQWTLSSSAGGLYNLKIDNNEYLTQKVTPNSENQLTLSDDVAGDLGFALVEAEQGCGILQDGKEYNLKSLDGRFAVLDRYKQLGFVSDVPSFKASKFTAIQKGCNVYGLCVDGNCMARCEGCSSDTGDYQTVRFHVKDSDAPYSQWTLSSSVAASFYNLKTDDPYGYLIYKQTADGNDQLTLSTDITLSKRRKRSTDPPEVSSFEFVEAEQGCGILQDGKEYNLQSSDGRFAVLDENKQLGFVRDVPSFKASKFTAIQKGCNVYGLCVDGNCMSRCEACVSDTGDYQTVRFHARNSDGAYSQWTLSSSAGGLYNLKIDNNEYLTQKVTPNSENQLTLSDDVTGDIGFALVEAEQGCGILQDGKEYNLQSSDGRFAVLDENKQLGFVRDVPSFKASKFTAIQKGCNVYGLCVDGNCMSRCEACVSDTGDYQTVRFHARNSDGAYSQWTLTSSAGGLYNLKIDNNEYLTQKVTPNSENQLTLSDDVTGDLGFALVEAEQGCGILQDGKEYNLQSSDGRFAVLDENKQLGFVRDVPSFKASKFTAIQKGCNVYGLCVDGNCMSRCEACVSDTGDYQTVRFHARNSDGAYSQWTLSSSTGGLYNLKIDNNEYLTQKVTPNSENQLTLSDDVTGDLGFALVEAEQGCGILRDGKEYNLQSSDGRFAVLDENKQLGFVRDVPSFKASKFTAIQKGCNVYGLCVDGNCMSRCEACVSDTGDYQTVRFHARNSDGAYSQWTLTSSAGGLYNLKIDNNEYLTQKVTPNSENQLTLSDDVTGDLGFALVEAEQGCGILQDGKEYNLQSSDGRFAVLDENKQLGFVRDVPSFKASKFTAIQKGCNVYGLCVDGNCMSRCEACVSDTGDYQTVRFHARNSDGAYSQWTLTSSAGGLYNLKIDNNEYLTQKVTPNSENQLTLSDDVTGDLGFALVEAEQGCGILQDGKEYNLQSSDGRFAVLDENKQLGFVRDVPSFKASKFTAIQKGCNVYGLCVDGNCMSRCEACVSDTGDYQTVRFHARNSDGAYSQWTLSSSVGGLYNLKIDNNEYLTQKVTPNSENQLTLSDDVAGDLGFALVEAEQGCGILQDGKEYNLKSLDGRFAVLDRNKQLGFVSDVPSFKASKFTAIQKGCNVYGLCVDGNCMARCEGCSSDTGDYQTVRFHVKDSDAPYSQWTLSSSVAASFYNLKTDDPYGYLIYKQTADGNDQLTLSTDITLSKRRKRSTDPPEVSSFEFVEAEQGCGILQDGKEYNLQSSDGRFAVLDENKQLGFVRDVPSFKASKFTAIQKGCNVYGLCVDGNCMSRCEACVSDTGDYQTVRFHARNSDGAYSQWTLASSAGGLYNLKIDNNEYLTQKVTPNSENQLTLSDDVTGDLGFALVEAEQGCGILQDGKEYNLQSSDGRFAVLDENKQLGFVRDVPSFKASKFTAIQKGCNVYGLCVDGNCMSRCEACVSDTGDYQTVRFHARNSDGAYSQWTLSSSAGGLYNLKIDNNEYLTQKVTPNSENQLTLSDDVTGDLGFALVEAEQGCGILQDGKEYNLQSSDGRFAVLDENKQLGFVRDVPSFKASKFTAIQKGCNVYGLCVDGNCMSRCEACVSDTGDYQTVRFHARNSDGAYSQWTLSSSAGGLYNLKIDNNEYLTQKVTPNSENQLTLSDDVTGDLGFALVEAEQGCGILQDGKEYNLQSSDGRFAVLDENKQLGFVRDVPSFKASKFTAIQKGCNVYGLCVDGNCMSRCEACVSDTGDYQTVRFHARNSDGAYSQWTLTSSAGGLYNLKIDNNEYLTQKVTPNSENQLTLSDDVTGDLGFALVEAEQGCGILQDGKEYNLQSSDGRFAVLDENKQLGFVRDVPSFKASKFTAIQKGCNVYGLCVDGNCMSRCEACVSDTGDYQTVRFHARNSDGAYSQWTLSSSAGGLYNLKIDNNEYLTQKVTPNSENQLTLSDDVTGDLGFALVEAEQGCGILQDGKEYNLQSSDGRFAVLDENKQLGFVRDVPSFKASKFTAIQKGCNVYGLCVDGNCMSRCEACVSDTGDYQTVRFHARNSDGAYSQWTLSSSAGGLYNLKIDNNEYLSQKVTPNSENQLTLSDDVTGDLGFALVEAEQGCGILQDGKEYNLQSSDGRFAVLDENKQLGFVRDVPSFKASKFTAIQKGCNVYGLCVDGNCMSRCEACVSDTGDYQTVRFHARNSDGAYSQWTLTSSAGGLYNLKIDNNEYLTQKVTPNSDNQLTLSDDVTGDLGFALVEAEQGCGILQDGKEYNLKTLDGRFGVLDISKQLGFVRNVPSLEASKFTAIQKGCNVYGLCVDGNCMSRCEACVSDTGDYQTVRFHARNSDGAYSQWTLTSSAGGLYNLKIDDPYGFLTEKTTPNGDNQLTLSSEITSGSGFAFEEL